MSPAARLATYFHVHLVSDSTGETLNAMARAVCARFDNVLPIEHIYALVRSPRQLERALEEIANAPGVVLHTIVDPALRGALEAGCQQMDMPCLPALDPLVSALSRYLGATGSARAGARLDADYFDRIDALNYALAHDDGQGAQELERADVVLVGVSRTSKTPTALYLANRGVKAANVPFVPGVPLPPELISATRPLVVGLTNDPERLIQLRRNRLSSLHQDDTTEYTDLDAVRVEVREARRVFSERHWPVIDVTRRSIEETAAAILKLLARRHGLDA